MGPENEGKDLVAYIDGQPVEIADITMPDIQAAPNEDLPGIFTAGFSSAAFCASVSCAALVEAFRRALEAVQPAIAALAEMIGAADEWDCALAAADIYRPKWAHFYRHTKKRRIRKKYMKRIVRWYREEVESVVEA